jgi:hypothetical protein
VAESPAKQPTAATKRPAAYRPCVFCGCLHPPGLLCLVPAGGSDYPDVGRQPTQCSEAKPGRIGPAGNAPVGALSAVRWPLRRRWAPRWPLPAGQPDACRDPSCLGTAFTPHVGGSACPLALVWPRSAANADPPPPTKGQHTGGETRRISSATPADRYASVLRHFGRDVTGGCGVRNPLRSGRATQGARRRQDHGPGLVVWE